MPRRPERASLSQVETIVRDYMGLQPELSLDRTASPDQADLVFHAPTCTIAVEWKAAGDAASVGGAIRQLQKYAPRTRRSRPVVRIVAVPFMGDTGKALCAEAGVSWIDISGNARIDAPGRHVRIEGRSKRGAARGRPSNVFAPRSSRLARALLMAPHRALTQGELAAASGVDKGRVSRLVHRLLAMGLVDRPGTPPTVRAADPDLLLDSWHEAYDFWKHEVLQGHVATRSPEELIARIRKAYGGNDAWALTGLAGAWRFTQSAMYRLTTVLATERPTAALLSTIGFREEPRGANLWIVVPVDESAFDGARIVDRAPCAHPLQVYLDLKAHPERAKEAASELRRKHLKWRRR